MYRKNRPDAIGMQFPEHALNLPHGESMRFISHILDYSVTFLRCAICHPLPPGAGDSPQSSLWTVEMAAQASGVFLNLKDEAGNSAAEGRLVQIRSMMLAGPQLPRDERLVVDAQLQSASSVGYNVFQCTVATESIGDVLLEATLALLVRKGGVTR